MLSIVKLLKEYSREQQVKYLPKIEKVIKKFTSNMPDPGKAADPYINLGLELFPSVRYTGKLYRVIYITSETFPSFKSNSEVLDYIKKDKTKHFQSFSKSLEGLQKFESVSLGGDVEDFDPIVAVYVEQVGSGLDVKKFYKNKDSLTESNLSKGGLEASAYVEEVIAPIDTTTMQIGMYVLHDNPNTRMYKYNPSRFNQLQKDLQESLEDVENLISNDYYLSNEPRKGFDNPSFHSGRTMSTDLSINKKSKYKDYDVDFEEL